MIRVPGCEAPIRTSQADTEPRVAPGSKWGDALRSYGPSFERQAFARVWNQGRYEVTIDDYGAGVAGPVSVSVPVDGRQQVGTFDGFVVGKDTYGAVIKALSDRRVPHREFIQQGEGIWLLEVAFESACGHQFVAVYSWTLEGNPEADRVIGNREPYRTQPFLGRAIEVYSLNPLKGFYEKQSGHRTDAD